MEILSREKLHLLNYFVTGISKVFLEVVSHYVCYSVCVSIFEKNSKVKFLIFFAWVVSFVFLMWDRCGSF